MANNPVQIVLNSSDFILQWDRQGGGPHKDFYADKDKEFVAHRAKIVEQINAVRPRRANSEFSDIVYAKVTLKQSALAKSHRPTKEIFKSDIAPIVGGGDLGEIFVELQPSSIDKITEKVLKAEDKTNWKQNKDNKAVAHPSGIRSEVGAIEDIRLYAPSDKRSFSLSEGLEWISDPRTGGGYIIELFELPPPRQTWDALSPQKARLFSSFYEGLTGLGPGLVASRVTSGENNIPMVSIRLETSPDSPIIQLVPTRSSIRRKLSPPRIDLSRARHSSLINFLDNHPIVRRVSLPPVISQSKAKVSHSPIGTKFNLPKVVARKIYPKVAIVDGGVSDILAEWIESRHGLISSGDKDEDHGTFIAGLLLSGNSLNKDICQELDGCKVIDLDLLPKDQYFSSYYADSLQFFDELENAVRELKAKTGVRVFNFSLNIEEHVSADDYSIPARRLDEIAETNNIIFVISAGKSEPSDWRKEWPEDASEALRILSTSRNDTIMKPAESYRNLSVSGLNPPNLDGIVPYSLSNYSCRGPGTRIGLKPDLAHVGGSGTSITSMGHGLFSIDKAGKIVDGCGTSYAAPHVAKSLACLEFAIEGEVSRESLIGLAIHNAKVPEVMLGKDLKDIAKDLVGFGIPESSDDILIGNENRITLVFANRIYPGKRMSFGFAWPASLTKDGKCFGHAKLTIVSTPPFDYRFGSEFVRVNIQGNLRQQQLDGKFKGRLSPVYLPESGNNQLFEKNRIEYAFKWSPIKVLEKNFPLGVGPTTNWRLEVEYLARDGDTLPVTGVPFTALLTISDPNGEAPVFDEMRQSLQAHGVQILDIMTAARVVSRV